MTTRSRTATSPTPTSASGRSTSTGCSASGATRQGPSSTRSLRRAASGRTFAMTAAARIVDRQRHGQDGPAQRAAAPSGGLHQQYMNYLDNPWRPRHRLWFGPGTMIQFMMDCGYLPGTTHDISMFPMKQGVGGALTDIQNNHPNDLVAMLLFSRPVYGNDPAGIGQFNVPQYSLTNDYASMLTSLWVPPGSGSLGSDVKLFGDPTPALIPAAHADFDSNTASSFGFMQAYNQFSGNHGALVHQAGMGGDRDGDGRRPRPQGRHPARHLRDRRHGQRGQRPRHSGHHQRRGVQLLLQHPPGRHGERRRLQSKRTCSRWSRPSATATTARRCPCPAAIRRRQTVPGYATINQAGDRSSASPSAPFSRTPNSTQTSAVRAPATDLDDRRHHLPQFVHRPDQRLQVVHRHVAATPDQTAAGLPQYPGQQRTGVAD